MRILSAGTTPGTKPPKETIRDQVVRANKTRKGKRANGSGTFPNPPGGGGGPGLTPHDRNQRYGAMGGFPGVRYGDALSLVNAEIHKGLYDYKNEKQKLRRETQEERQRANRLYTRATGDLNHVFDESGQYIGYQNQAIQDQYSQLNDRSQQAQAALLDHLQTQGQSNMGAAQSELARLGIGGPGMLDQMAADQSNMTNVANQTGANNAANINLQATAAGDVGNLLAGMNAGSRASAIGQQATARSDALFEAEATKKKGMEQLTRAMQDLRGSRGDLTRQMLEQLRESRWGEYVDQANLNLQRRAQAAQEKYYSNYNSGGGYSNYSGSGGSYSPPTGSPSSTDDASLNAYNQMILNMLGGGGNKPKPKPKGGKKP